MLFLKNQKPQNLPKFDFGRFFAILNDFFSIPLVINLARSDDGPKRDFAASIEPFLKHSGSSRNDEHRQKAVFLAYDETKTTVLTSGLILIGAGYVLGWSSSIPSIAVFGTLIGRGAVISTILVLFILPQVMMIFDKFIQKTTIKKASKTKI